MLFILLLFQLISQSFCQWDRMINSGFQQAGSGSNGAQKMADAGMKLNNPFYEQNQGKGMESEYRFDPVNPNPLRKDSGTSGTFMAMARSPVAVTDYNSVVFDSPQQRLVERFLRKF